MASVYIETNKYEHKSIRHSFRITSGMLYFKALSSFIFQVLEDIYFTSNHQMAITLSLSLLVLIVPSTRVAKWHGMLINIDCQLDRI